VEGAEINVTVHTRAWGRNAQEAQEQLARVQLMPTQTGDSLRLELEDAENVCSGRQRRPPEVSFTIETPVETAVQASSDFGSVSLDGTRGAAELQSDFGDIQASNLEGALAVETNNGAVTVRGVQAGDAEINLNSDFGRIQVEDAAAGALMISAVNGTIEVQRATIAGAATLESDFGSVSWSGGEAGSLEVTSKNGEVRLSDLEIDGALNVTSDFGGVTVEGVSAASYTVVSKNGAIVVNGATGDVTAQSDFGSVDVTADVEATVDLRSESGPVTYSGSLGEGENVVHSGFGNVTVRLPQDSSFAADMETDMGKISSDFPITIQGSPDAGHWQGQVGDGGPTLVASTQSGNTILEYR
jgi:DUF4097 and DUF4098 domain-containing protein YvlB